MYNKVILIGNLGNDPEVKKVGETSLCTFSVATSKRFKKGDQWVDKTEWHKIVAWGKNGEAIAKWFKKGSKILVEGSIESNNWTNKEGVEIKTTQIALEGFKFIEKKSFDTQGTPGTKIDSGANYEVLEDDIPF